VLGDFCPFESPEANSQMLQQDQSPPGGFPPAAFRGDIVDDGDALVEEKDDAEPAGCDAFGRSESGTTRGRR
jgi:hypothetical protein